MRWFVLGVAESVVMAAAAFVGVAAIASPQDTAVRTLILRDGDYVVIPKLDMTCWYGGSDMGFGYRPALDCGRTSTEMEGKRMIATARVGELWHWAEVPGWKLIARTKRNP